MGDFCSDWLRENEAALSEADFIVGGARVARGTGLPTNVESQESAGPAE